MPKSKIILLKGETNSFKTIREIEAEVAYIERFFQSSSSFMMAIDKLIS